MCTALFQSNSYIGELDPVGKVGTPSGLVLSSSWIALRLVQCAVLYCNDIM